MTEAPSPQTRLNLERFAKLVQDNPQVVLRRSADFEFIDLGEFKRDFRYFSGGLFKKTKCS